MNKQITLAMGNSAEENNEFISKIFYKSFKNETLEKNELIMNLQYDIYSNPTSLKCYDMKKYLRYLL